MIEIVKASDVGYASKPNHATMKITHMLTDAQQLEIVRVAVESLGISKVLDVAFAASKLSKEQLEALSYLKNNHPPMRTKRDYVAISYGANGLVFVSNSKELTTNCALVHVTSNPEMRLRIFQEIAVVEAETLNGQVRKVVVKEIN